MTRRTERALIAILIGVVATGCSSESSNRDLVADKAGQALNLKRLAPAVEDLKAIVDPQYAKAEGTAQAFGCGEDDGQVFEPEANQSWTLTGPATSDIDPTSVDADPLAVTPAGVRAMKSIETQLVSQGWRLDEGTDVPNFITMTRNGEGYELGLGMQGFDDGIIVTVTTTPENVCVE